MLEESGTSVAPPEHRCSGRVQLQDKPKQEGYCTHHDSDIIESGESESEYEESMEESGEESTEESGEKRKEIKGKGTMHELTEEEEELFELVSIILLVILTKLHMSFRLSLWEAREK